MTNPTDISTPSISDQVDICILGTLDYQDVWDRMRKFNEQRTQATKDEIWIVEHPPVFTLGLNGKADHILDAKNIPVIKSDRGGQVTYHGPGQLVAYILMDLERRHWGVKKLVDKIEQSIIELLSEYSIDAGRKEGAPGVYVNDAKVAALGLRVKRGCSYHGLSLNVEMDLSPFQQINPCGYADLASVQMSELAPDINIKEVTTKLISHLNSQLYANLES